MRTKKWLGMLSSVGLPLLFGVIVFMLWQTQALHSWLGTDTITLPLPTRIGEIISQNKDAGRTGSRKYPGVPHRGDRFDIPQVGRRRTYDSIRVQRDPDRGSGSGHQQLDARRQQRRFHQKHARKDNRCDDILHGGDERQRVPRAYRAAPKIVVFTKLRLPNSLPYVFTALRVSVPASVIGALVTEYFAEDTVGVGRQIRENIVKGQYPTAWAYIATACAIGIGMYIILMLVERLVLKRRKA